MKDIFDNIKGWLRKLNRNTVLESLLPGADDQLVYRFKKETGMDIPDDLLDLYRICQGSEIRDGDKLNTFHFFPGFYFMPLKDSFLDYNVLKNDKRWDSNWFPVFANGGGDFYCVDCSNELESPIVEFMLDYDIEVVHRSIFNMLKTIEECFEEEAYFVDDKNSLEIDYKKENKIRKIINGYD